MLSGAARAAVPAVDVHFGADEFAGRDGGNLLAHALDRSAELVAESDRRLDAVLRPAVPAVDVQVRPADRGGSDAHEDFSRAKNRDGNGCQLESAGRAQLAQGLHRG